LKHIKYKKKNHHHLATIRARIRWLSRCWIWMTPILAKLGIGRTSEMGTMAADVGESVVNAMACSMATTRHISMMTRAARQYRDGLDIYQGSIPGN
jgi:hypothetical protein